MSKKLGQPAKGVDPKIIPVNLYAPEREKLAAIILKKGLSIPNYFRGLIEKDYRRLFKGAENVGKK